MKTKNGWTLTRENTERKDWKKPRYIYRVYDVQEGSQYLVTDSLSQATDSFEYQSKFE